MSSMLTLSVQRPNVSSSSSSSSSDNSSLSPLVPAATSPCITPQPQTQVVTPVHTVPLVRNGRKRPGFSLPPLQLESALEHRRRENEARARDIKAQIEASFLGEAPSSPGGYSTSSESQPSGSDDDSCVKGQKRIRYDSSTPSVCSTDSVESLESECNGASSSRLTHLFETPKILGANEYQVMNQGDEFLVLEIATNKLFTGIKMDAGKYKHFMKVAARIESARKHFCLEEFRRLKSKIIPDDTRIVHGSSGISYLLLPSPHTSLSTKVKDPTRPKDRVRLPEEEVQSIVFQLVEMMEFCHSVGLFFGDFKFDKLVFTNSQKTQIRPRSPLIFLLSNGIEDDTMSGGTKVGWAFMAPEMLKRGQSNYSGAAADIWALGVLAFTLLVGNYPFIANDPQTLFNRIRSRNIAARIENLASPEGRIMVYSLLCKNPSERPSAQLLKQCHWLQMRNEPKNPQVTVTAAVTTSECHLRQLHSQLVQMAQQPLARGNLPRVSSDRRLRFMEQARFAMLRTQSSDQVVPATAPVLMPATTPSSRLFFQGEAPRR